MTTKPRLRPQTDATASARWLRLAASCAGAWLVASLLGWALIAPSSPKSSVQRPALPLPVELDGVNIPPIPTLELRPTASPAAPAAKTDGLSSW